MTGPRGGRLRDLGRSAPRPIHSWRGLDRSERTVFGVLGALLLVGALLRGAVMLAAPPALLGYPDSLPYMSSAADQLFSDPGHPVGYAGFVRILHAVDSHLLALVAVQHLLGLASGTLLFLTLRRAGIVGLASLLPAGVVLLGGPVVLLEQAPMSEALFVFLQAGALYAAVRALDSSGLGWAVVMGALMGASVLVRPVAALLIVVLVCWLAVVGGGRFPRRALAPGVALLAAIVPVAAHAGVQGHLTGAPGLVRASGWYVYARAAPFADCEEFTPPARTAHLCERTAPSRRPGPNDYIFDAKSPAVRAYGSVRAASREANAELGSFGRAATLHQPLDWLKQGLTEELPRYVSSARLIREDQGMDFERLADTLTTPASTEMSAQASAFYKDGAASSRRRDLGALLSYERWTRVDGPVSVALMVLALAGVALSSGRARSVAVLLALLAVGGMVAPALTLFYDARYAIATWGPLAAAAGIGTAALAARFGRRTAHGG